MPSCAHRGDPGAELRVVADGGGARRSAARRVEPGARPPGDPAAFPLADLDQRAGGEAARVAGGVELVIERDHERLGVGEPLQQRAELRYGIGQVTQPARRPGPRPDSRRSPRARARGQAAPTHGHVRPAHRGPPWPATSRAPRTSCRCCGPRLRDRLRGRSPPARRSRAPAGGPCGSPAPEPQRAPDAAPVAPARPVCAGRRSALQSQTAIAARPARITIASRIIAIGSGAARVASDAVSAAAGCGGERVERDRLARHALDRRGFVQARDVRTSPRPVRGRPCLTWNQITAARVRGPKRPSTGPGR